MKAVELLAAGRSIKEGSFAVGYQQASTFVAMFRRSLGVTPKAWISALTARPSATTRSRQAVMPHCNGIQQTDS